MTKVARGIMLGLIAAMLLSGAALAQEYYTLPEVREQAAKGWHETYEAYGREITVDVEARVPDVEKVPVERLEFARMEPLVTEEESGLEIVARPEENVFGYHTRTTNEELSDELLQKNEGFIGYPDEWERAYALGSTVTLTEAVDIVRKSLAVMHLDADNWDLERPYEMATFSFKDRKTEEVAAPGEYMLYFHQKVNGIPLLNHAGATFQLKTRGNATIHLSAIVTDQDRYSISPTMLKSVGSVAEDVPLCSFEKVKEAFEKEIEEGHIRKVYDLSFGYLFYEDPEYVSSDTWTDHFYALPVWQLDCLYMSNREKELPEYGLDETGDERASLEYASLTVDAQTGKLRNFMDRDDKRALYKGFVPWDDARKGR